MEEINHVSHEEHPLMLIENAQMVVGGVDGDDDGKREIICSWCQEPILGATYGCTSCDYFMHKTCAQLEPIFNHYLHRKHPLFLSRHENRSLCDVCDKHNVTEFIYNCSSCKFSACIKCCVVAARLKDATNVKVKIEGHPDHTLALQLRLGTFRCDACQTDDKDLFYQCNDCPFWIHKTCATLAPNIHLPHYHHHPLLLAYELPERFYNFPYECKFCKETILGSIWLYHCANCRYFAHIKCALRANEQPLTPRDGLGATSNAEEQANDHDLLHFPMSKAFNDPLKLLYLEKTTPDNDNATEIIHWSHHHPLMLNVKPQGNIMLDIDHGDPIIVCHGCVRPLTLPYYSCKDGCGFFLHKYCAELPRTLQHKLHIHHSLHLVHYQASKFKTYKCSGCLVLGNTFVYKCEPCKFYLDVNCAFLPNTIKHEFHKHSLVQGINPSRGCNASNYGFRGISYLCEACDFQLHMYCALQSPYSLAHRYCKGHEVPLTYPPVEDHIEDFYCTICEKEMNPNYWLYHCNKCDNSFHLGCIGNIDWYGGNKQLEGTVSVSYHKHPLTLVRRKKTPRYVCFGCNHDINGHLILECRSGTCPFRICTRCHNKNRGRKHL